jgi:hypothetical protein
MHKLTNFIYRESNIRTGEGQILQTNNTLIYCVRDSALKYNYLVWQF